jgi:hypothetical protein
MQKQQGKGVRIKGEKDQHWGLAMGYQSSNIDLQPIVPSPRQNQDDWRLSSFVHMPSSLVPGKVTLQMDVYRTLINPDQSPSSDVLTWVPQIIWQSQALPLKLDFSYAHSVYQKTERVHQISTGLTYGFNNYQNWVQVRGYYIDNLKSMGIQDKDNAFSADIKLTHILNATSPLIPASVTVGLERGKKIYYADLTTQTLQNAPLMNEKSENIAANWKVSNQTNFDIYWVRNKYIAYQPFERHIRLSTLGVKVNKSW